MTPRFCSDQSDNSVEQEIESIVSMSNQSEPASHEQPSMMSMGAPPPCTGPCAQNEQEKSDTSVDPNIVTKSYQSMSKPSHHMLASKRHPSMSDGTHPPCTGSCTQSMQDQSDISVDQDNEPIVTR